MLIEREYEYKPKWWIILLCGAMFGVATVFFTQDALSNDRGLIINGLIELSENGATIFYWVFAFFSFCFVLGAIALVVHRVKFHQRIAFTHAEIIVPASQWSTAEKGIKYADISSLSITNVSGRKYLNINHSGGKSVINAMMLGASKNFDEVVDLLTKKIE